MYSRYARLRRTARGTVNRSICSVAAKLRTVIDLLIPIYITRWARAQPAAAAAAALFFTPSRLRETKKSAGAGAGVISPDADLIFYLRVRARPSNRGKKGGTSRETLVRTRPEIGGAPRVVGNLVRCIFLGLRGVLARPVC